MTVTTDCAEKCPRMRPHPLPPLPSSPMIIARFPMSHKCSGWHIDGVELTRCACVCAVIRCSGLADPDHGLIRCDSETLYGSRCELDCHSGYAVVGQPIIECLEHGHWSHDSPLCAGLVSATRFLAPDRLRLSVLFSRHGRQRTSDIGRVLPFLSPLSLPSLFPFPLPASLPLFHSFPLSPSHLPVIQLGIFYDHTLSCITWKLSCGHVCKMFGRQWPNEQKIAIFYDHTLISSPPQRVRAESGHQTHFVAFRGKK